MRLRSRLRSAAGRLFCQIDVLVRSMQAERSGAPPIRLAPPTFAAPGFVSLSRGRLVDP
jgi:hypothetical protein